MDREHEEEEEDEGKRRWLHLLLTKWDGLGYDEKAKAIHYIQGWSGLSGRLLPLLWRSRSSKPAPMVIRSEDKGGRQLAT
ncbi:unnamed protein product [Musa acuminata var. zebrina]